MSKTLRNVPPNAGMWHRARKMKDVPRTSHTEEIFRDVCPYTPTLDGAMYLATIVVGKDRTNGTAVIYTNTHPDVAHPETGEMYYVLPSDDPTCGRLPEGWQECGRYTKSKSI